MADKPTVLVCPECGVSMEGLDPVGHALTHYPEYLDPAISGKKARVIQAKILEGGVSPEDYQKLHEE